MAGKCVNCGRDLDGHLQVATPQIQPDNRVVVSALICPTAVYKPVKGKPVRDAKS